MSKKQLFGSISSKKCSERMTLREWLKLTQLVDKVYKRSNVKFDVMNIIREPDGGLIVLCKTDNADLRMRVH